MTTHRVNDIVRGKQSGRLALVKEVGEQTTVFEYLEDAKPGGTAKKGDVVQRFHGSFEPARPDAVGQHVRLHTGDPLSPVLSIGQGQLVTVKEGTFFRDNLVRVAEPELAPRLYFPSDGDVERFKRAWEKADREGKYGERVRAGLEASISFVVSEIIAERDRRGRVLEEVRAELNAVQEHAAQERVEHARALQAKCDEIVRLEQQIAESAAQRSEVRDCFIMGGEGLELKETPGAHISIKGADISPRGTIAALKNRADTAEATVARQREALAELLPDPDAAAKAALQRFRNYTDEQAQRAWSVLAFDLRDAWRRVAAS